MGSDTAPFEENLPSAFADLFAYWFDSGGNQVEIEFW
jgi:hypothetical protein